MLQGIPVGLALCCLLFAPGQVLRGQEKYRGYTIMAGGLGRPPRGPTRMWGNTVQAHLDFISKAKINLVVIEVPYGVSKKHPKSATVVSFIKRLRQLKRPGVEVWIIYPHVLAQTFDLPRQVDRRGKTVAWNCCFNHGEVQDWMVDNGKSIAAAYRPDGLILFGTFHVGSECHCDRCKGKGKGKGAKKGKKIKSAKSMEAFFVRWRSEVRAVVPKIKLGTCCFWSKPSKKTLAALDVICPVVPVYRPGYSDAGQVKGKRAGWKSEFRGKPVVPYIKIFLAHQTHSRTADILAAAEESIEHCQGFFFWGYNPGHSYNRQDYDHGEIRSRLAAMDGNRRK